VPNKAIRVANGERTVTVMTGLGQTQQIPVTIGLTNETYSEITGGSLKEGDRVVIAGSTTTGSSSTTEQQGPGLGGLLGGNGPMEGGGAPPGGGGVPPSP